MTLMELTEYAYEKWRSRLGPQGIREPAWDDLTAKKRAAWSYAVQAVWNVVDDHVDLRPVAGEDSAGLQGGATPPGPTNSAAADSSRVAEGVSESEVREAIAQVNDHIGIDPKITHKGDEVKCWTPDRDGEPGKTYLSADACDELANAFYVLGVKLRTANPKGETK